MKTCISTYSFDQLLRSGNFSCYDAIDKVCEYGMDAVELQLDAKRPPEGESFESYAKKLTDYAEKKGLEVPILTVTANFHCENPDAEVARVCACVDVAAACGIPMMRHDATYRYMDGDRIKTPHAVIERIAPYIRRVAEYAAERGVRTCTENHGRLLQDSDRVQALIDAVNHENFGWLCDIGNFGAVDEDCSTAVSRLLPSLCFVHAKDCIVRSGSLYHPGRGFVATRGGNFRRATILGHGDVPVYQILRAIAGSGYNGYVSIEHEGIEDNLLALQIGSENLKRMLSDLAREGEIGK